MSNRQYPQTIFVVGTDRDIGKTVTSIGLIAKLLSGEHRYATEEIGYIKPVGQQTMTVLNGEGIPIEADKDAVLITSLMGIRNHGYEKTSPVVWRDGVTAEYIDQATEGNPQTGRNAFMERIRAAYEDVSAGKRIMIVEGTGQPGVGSVAGISNADVINLLRGMGVPVYVVMVTRAGIGATIDQVFPYLLAMDRMGTRVDGLIINDVIPTKMEKVRSYLTRYYGRIFESLYGDRLDVQTPPTILGFVPSVPELRLPTMRFIAEHFANEADSAMEVIAPEDFDLGATQLVNKLKVISLDFGYESFLEPGDAVIVGVNSNDVILAMLLLHERMVRKHGRGLSGLILSCKYVGGLSAEIRDLIAAGDLPTITLNYDSADIVHRVERMTVKIRPYDVDKRNLIARVYNDSLTLWPELSLMGRA
ncbi:MAG: AAA family ATPase [Anaerolineae bacterium]|jgi:dethiobiotin synthetase